MFKYYVKQENICFKTLGYLNFLNFRLQKMHRKGERDSLCCCEYVNAAGEHSHILAMCCDCQDLDLVCDR